MTKTLQSVKNFFQKHFLIILTIFLVAIVSIIRYKDPTTISYRNSDATDHALLTIRAYDETPVSEHLFLPITTLGDPDDKNIPWGANVPDDKGNYYYTSFSPAGYFLPWLFTKLVSPFADTQFGLYLFNTLLFTISAILWVKIIAFLYRKSKYSVVLGVIALLAYITAPEILQGMGLTYWHQSIMQATLLIQLFAYLKMEQNSSRSSKIIFYLMCLLNPYIEWTGFVANLGFMIVILISHWKDNRKIAFKKSGLVLLFTILSLALFCCHYLLLVDAHTFFQVVKARFFSRNASTSAPISSLIAGYYTSFGTLWLLLLILIFWNFSRQQKFTLNHRLILLLLLFPLLENFLMRQHAIEYTYDRMKLIFPLSLIICEFAYNILISTKKRQKLVSAALICLATLSSILNLANYLKDPTYVKSDNYQQYNQILADYINKKYDSSVLNYNYGVRGYVNLLYGRGVYENQSLEYLQNIAKDQQKDYVVMLITNEPGSIARHSITDAIIYNLQDNTSKVVRVNPETLTVEEVIESTEPQTTTP